MSGVTRFRAFWAFLLFFLPISTSTAIPGRAATALSEGGEGDSQSELKGSRRVSDALEILIRVDSGHRLIQDALRTWKLKAPVELLGFVKLGESSRTDAVLTRHFDPQTGEETRERQVTIYLKENQSLENLVLDIAHEMVHATARPVWDPYDPELTASRYIKNAIEGEGGEVAAVYRECEVALELSNRYGVSTDRCQSYFKNKGPAVALDVLKIRQDFYRVGKWKKPLIENLKKDAANLPLLSSDNARLYSSTGNAPYPVALLEEFNELTAIACENSRKREESMGASAGAGPRRDLASVKDSASLFISRRCRAGS